MSIGLDGRGGDLASPKMGFMSYGEGVTFEGAGPVRRWGWDAVLWVGLAFWVVGFCWHAARPASLWLLDLVVIPLAALLYWAGFVMVIVGLVGAHRWKEMALVPVLVVLTLMVNPAWMVAPRTWFALHRPLFEIALRTDPGSDYYGNELPPPLRFLTATGRVSEVDGSTFFPRWVGTPDDAGGYLHSPERSPEGADLYGQICRSPVDLGDGWWMCEMSDSGL